MARLVVGKVARKGKRRLGAGAKKRRVRAGGQIVEQFWVDSGSRTFAEDLTSVFQLNVARARQANSAVFGSPDGPPKDIQKLKQFGFADAAPKK